MRPATIVIGGIAIGIVSGMGGFFLGRIQESHSGNAAKNPPPAILSGPRPSAVAGQNETAVTAFKDPRPELDRERNPLARFKMALNQLEGWMNADPLAALTWLKGQQPSARRDEVIRMALGQYSESDPKGAAQWALENLTNAELNNSLILISGAWAQANGLEAANWMSALPVSKERDAAMENLIFAWASEDPAAALAFLDKSPVEDALTSTLRRAAYAGWAKSDPQGAVTASLQSSRNLNDAVQFANTLANWATMDLTGSSEWLLDNVKDGEQRALAVEELATIFAHQSPDAGLAWIEKLRSGAEREAAVNRLATEWAASDPAAAAQWAAKQEPGRLTGESVAAILHNFLAENSAAFEAWRATLPESPLKEQATSVGVMAAEE